MIEGTGKGLRESLLPHVGLLMSRMPLPTKRAQDIKDASCRRQIFRPKMSQDRRKERRFEDRGKESRSTSRDIHGV